MAIRILPYKAGSASARSLANEMGVRLMRAEGSTLRDSERLSIINWGNSRTDLSSFTQAAIYNRNIGVASNKLSFFRAIVAHNIANPDEGVSIPPFTDDIEVAKGWSGAGHVVVAREKLSGHSGDGIVIVAAEGVVPEAPLYTKYVKKRDEYRVHVVSGVVVDVQQKRRNTEISGDDVNWQVRNHSNGFIFAREGANPHESVLSNAVNCVKALNLDFGAVDIIWNNRAQQATVLEVNTACGLSGTTLTSYKNALSSLVLGAEPNAWEFSEEVPDEEVATPEEPARFEVGDRVVITRRNVTQSHPHMTPEMVRRASSNGFDQVYTVQRVYSNTSCDDGYLVSIAGEGLGGFTFAPSWLGRAPSTPSASVNAPTRRNQAPRLRSPQESVELPTLTPETFLVGDVVVITQEEGSDEGPGFTDYMVDQCREAGHNQRYIVETSADGEVELRGLSDERSWVDGLTFLDSWLARAPVHVGDVIKVVEGDRGFVGRVFSATASIVSARSIHTNLEINSFRRNVRILRGTAIPAATVATNLAGLVNLHRQGNPNQNYMVNIEGRSFGPYHRNLVYRTPMAKRDLTLFDREVREGASLNISVTSA